MHARVAMLALAAASWSARAALQPRALAALPYNAVTPAGWLRAELEVQAAGLQGAFPDSFGPYNNSQWLGGTDKTQDWMESYPVRRRHALLLVTGARPTLTFAPPPTHVTAVHARRLRGAGLPPA